MKLQLLLVSGCFMLWIITGIGDDKAYVSFSAISTDPPLFPRYIQDPVVIRMFHNNLVNLKKILET